MNPDSPLATGDVRDWVDALIARRKRFFTSPPNWVVGNRDAERRIHHWQLVDDETGVSTSAFVSLTAYPFDRTLRFTATLNVIPSGWNTPSCVWRLDVEPSWKPHTNRGAGVNLTGHSRITGSNYHPWSLNRHLCKPYTFAQALEVAMPLPSSVRQFDQGLRWFFGEVNIVVPSAQMPTWPSTAGQLL